jgi:hypothetical protein
MPLISAWVLLIAKVSLISLIQLKIHLVPHRLT